MRGPFWNGVTGVTGEGPEKKCDCGCNSKWQHAAPAGYTPSAK